jgi:TfoX/Sxy family transcriptional regulator of competence genes
VAYDQQLADRIMLELGEVGGLTTRKMFGGFAVMLNGNMLCGVMGDDLMVRVGADRGDALLEEPDAHPMDFTGRTMKGMLTVDGSSVADEDRLRFWLDRGIDFVGALPAK